MENYDPNGADGKHKVEWWSMPSSMMTTVTMDKSADGKNIRITASTGKASDIRTYDDYGSNCSRVIVSSWWGVPKHIIIIND